MSRIVIAGPWAYAWGAWHAARLFGLFWVARLGWPTSVDLYFAILYTVFLPMELGGAYANYRDRSGREVARTLSQTNQYVAQQGKPGAPNSTSWKALAALSGAIDAALVTMLVSAVNPWLGVIMGFGVALWLAPHYAWRGDTA